MRILSGIQTSGNGELHIGNYIGAVKQWIDLQEQSDDTYYMLANLHALTVPIEPEVARENVYKITALYLALGLDPAKTTIFAQSMVPAHAQLCWIFSTLTHMGELKRMTQFKDKAGQDTEGVSVGLFAYPVLQAADILLYQPTAVPVGEDQRQHIELTRNIAERFNHRYGPTFTVPDPLIPAAGARIMGLDDPSRKMSKSLGANNYISLLDDPATIVEKMKKAVTDSENEVRYDPKVKPAISNLLTIFSAITDLSTAELEGRLQNAGYGQFKTQLSEALIEFLAPVQAKYAGLISDRPLLEKILATGAAQASVTANTTLQLVRERVGLV